jgi:hypothetical protein
MPHIVCAPSVRLACACQAHGARGLWASANVQKKQQRKGSWAPFVVLKKLIGVVRIVPAQTIARLRGVP